MIVGVGLLMIVYVVFGGMKGTTWVQIVKAVMLMTGAAIMTIWVLAKFGFNPSALLGAAADASGKGESFLQPGLRYGVENADATKTLLSKLDFISLALALVLGTAGLPHILIRFYTVPDSKAARKSVLWAIGLIGIFYLMTLALGFGAAALVGSKAISEQSPGGNTAAPQLAEALGGVGTGLGAVMLAVIAAVAFATILAVVAGLTLASSSSLAHDLYSNVIKKGKVTDKQEVRVGRIAAVCIGAVSIALAIPAQSLNVAFLVAIAFAIAASANLPVDPVLAVLEAVQHQGRDLGHLRRADLGAGAADLLAERVRRCGQRHHRQGGEPDQRSGDQLRLVPAEQPGPGVDPVGLPVRDHRHDHQQGVQQGEMGRDGGALAHRCRSREGHQPLTSRGSTTLSALGSGR